MLFKMLTKRVMDVFDEELPGRSDVVWKMRKVLIYLILTETLNKGECIVDFTEGMSALKMNRESLKGYLKRLEDAGLIESKHDRKCPEYSLNV